MQGLQFQWDGQIRELGTIWTLRKGAREARCILCSNPLGWDLRLFVGEVFFQTQVCRQEREVFALAEEWRGKMEGKGWAP